MKKLLLALALALPLSAVSTFASAAPSCAKQAAGLKGNEKKDFIAQCKKEQKAKKPAKKLSPKAAKANRMAQCSADFKSSGAAPTDRPNFMKECLKHPQ